MQHQVPAASKAMVSSRALIGLLVAASSLAVARSGGGATTMFSYKEGKPNGPENWAKLSPAYKLCGKGKMQSPIDIITKKAVRNATLDSLKRTYDAVAATLVNNFHDISMTFGEKVGTVTVNGKVYSLDSLHWHSPSDHTINGKSFPLELHLVHKNTDGAVTVIAILYELGKPDPFYYQLKKQMVELGDDKCTMGEEESQVKVELMNLRSLQNCTGSYFRYKGSLTVPPCTENVIWNVLGQVRQISKEQLKLLKEPLPEDDNRPTQPLNGRKVHFYNPPGSIISFKT